ncbi:hypothetical protein [Rhizobium sp. 11515TR]|uniref:hypothetical protein n=1 Tax=Rhizobium sp. 11515TR TaxID=2028343 RepID=UPI000BA88EFF|nr:hypothetical protein [Rhizobium sp. 11515TR]ASW06264.1 hypothetical protein CKA34_10465 [Rhizobium sp. 11515TR]
MNSVFLLVRLNEDDSIFEIISAHPTKQIASNAERFYRTYTGKNVDNLRTDIHEVDFEVA